MSTIAKLVCACLLATGCPGQGSLSAADTVDDLCTRLDNCNYLPNGVSRQECVEDRTRCVEKLSPSQQDDWNVLMEHCLDLQSCSLYGDCWVDVPWC